MGDHPTFVGGKTPFLGSRVSRSAEPLLVEENQAMFDPHANESRQIVHVQLGHSGTYRRANQRLEAFSRVFALARRKTAGST